MIENAMANFLGISVLTILWIGFLIWQKISEGRTEPEDRALLIIGLILTSIAWAWLHFHYHYL